MTLRAFFIPPSQLSPVPWERWAPARHKERTVNEWSIAQPDFVCLEKPHSNSRSNQYQKFGEYVVAKLAHGLMFIDDLVESAIAEDDLFYQAFIIYYD